MNSGYECLSIDNCEIVIKILKESLLLGISRRFRRARAVGTITLGGLLSVKCLCKGRSTAVEELDDGNQCIAVLHFPKYLFLVDDHLPYLKYLLCGHLNL